MKPLIFLLLFLWHEIEEIAVLPSWIKENREQLEKILPLFLRELLATTKTTFAVIAGWELFLLVIIWRFLPQPWLFGVIFAYTAHFLLHLGQGIWLHRHVLPVPILWSVPCQTPLCFFLLWQMAENQPFFPLFSSGLVMTFFVLINLIGSHFILLKLQKCVTRKKANNLPFND